MNRPSEVALGWEEQTSDPNLRRLFARPAAGIAPSESAHGPDVYSVGRAAAQPPMIDAAAVIQRQCPRFFDFGRDAPITAHDVNATGTRTIPNRPATAVGTDIDQLDDHERYSNLAIKWAIGCH